MTVTLLLITAYGIPVCCTRIVNLLKLLPCDIFHYRYVYSFFNRNRLFSCVWQVWQLLINEYGGLCYIVWWCLLSNLIIIFTYLRYIIVRKTYGRYSIPNTLRRICNVFGYFLLPRCYFWIVHPSGSQVPNVANTWRGIRYDNFG